MDELAINKVITRNREFKAALNSRKLNVIEWGMKLSGRTDRNLDIHWVWTSKDGNHAVGLGKFGKEYYSSTIRRKDGSIGNNPSDMKPLVRKGRIILEFDGSFDHVFNFFQQVQKRAGDETLELLGCLMIRNAWLLDHQLVDGRYMYNPNQGVVDAISDRFPQYDNISTEAYLHYIDAIAQNEDTKYYTLGYDITTGTGRTNNLLTYANLIAVLLERASLAKMCSAFARPPVGVAPITMDVAKTAFPMLKIL